MTHAHRKVTFSSVTSDGQRDAEIYTESILWTWKEFKNQVERAGVTDDDVLAWIDVSGPCDFVKVERRANSCRIIAGFDIDY